MQIQASFACYDPLSYPMFFPNGEAGWYKRIPREGVDIRELVDDDDDDDAEDEKGPRDMRKRFLDAMTFVQDAGKPDTFLMMTCNPNWLEIVENLYEGQTAQDRPDLVTRDFYAKLEYLKHQLLLRHIYMLSSFRNRVYHTHFLLIMKSAHKLANPDHYDKVACAEIPDPNNHQDLHQLVLKHMIYGPCGHLNTQCPCMEGEPKKCRWNYPRQFQETTRQGDDLYPLYRRRDNGTEVNVWNSVLDNRWVVPYNPTLLMMFNCHINVEVCSSIKSVKYVFKNVYKGQVVNKIKRFQDAQYISPPEAMWFREDDVLTDILNRERNKRSMLIALFELNKTDPNAKQYLYRDIPMYYTWNKSTRVWKRRKQGKMRGIMVFANPTKGERFYLRALLQHVKGPTGFDYLYTVNDVLYT
ncbi:helicase-like protein, partial [Tanacetum coccineum]